MPTEIRSHDKSNGPLAQTTQDHVQICIGMSFLIQLLLDWRVVFLHDTSVAILVVVIYAYMWVLHKRKHATDCLHRRLALWRPISKATVNLQVCAPSTTRGRFG